jgi:hypothetical protein
MKSTPRHGDQTAWPRLILEDNQLWAILQCLTRRAVQVGKTGNELIGVAAAVGMVSANELAASRAVLLLGIHWVTSPPELGSLNRTVTSSVARPRGCGYWPLTPSSFGTEGVQIKRLHLPHR